MQTPAVLDAGDAPPDAAFGTILAARAVAPVFQPLVHLDSGQVAGFEALARGPEGSPLHSPAALFAAARRAGRLGELDWVCRTRALDEARRAGLDHSISWFVNVEPAALATPCPPDLEPVLHAAQGMPVVTELTERELDRDPARLLRMAAATRRAGWAVALDDVGALPRSLALLPFVQPDVVKLDMSLLGALDRAETAAVASAVRAYAELTGAVILAEGIETPEHDRAARVLGATYGQGWYHGRPGPLPASVPPCDHPFPRLDRALDREVGRTPFAIAAAARPAGRTTKAMLLQMSRHLERQAGRGGESHVLLASFQEDLQVTPSTRDRYAALSLGNVLTVAMAAGLSPGRVPGVRCVDLVASDPLAAEWNVTVVGPHFAGAILARDIGDDCADADRRFDYVITHDRGLVLRAARAMMRRVTDRA